MTWLARTKTDLIIEVWEKLDCENIGAAEIEAIEAVVTDQYGAAAVDSPMVIARLLADEGAELRHAEIMDLYVVRASVRRYDAAFRNLIKTDDLDSLLGSIRNLENLRLKYQSENDREGLRVVRETVISAKQSAIETAAKATIDPEARQLNTEVAQWLTIWLQTPEVFEHWVVLRQASAEFMAMFGANNET